MDCMQDNSLSTVCSLCTCLQNLDGVCLTTCFSFNYDSHSLHKFRLYKIYILIPTWLIYGNTSYKFCYDT